jgi:hypothetical protein
VGCRGRGPAVQPVPQPDRRGRPALGALGRVDLAVRRRPLSPPGAAGRPRRGP